MTPTASVPRQLILTLVLISLVFVGRALAGDRLCASPVTQVCTSEELEQIPTATLSNLNWRIQATPSGYSDFIIRGVDPFPQKDPRTGQQNLHEFVSGELMMAFQYNGMAPTWAEGCPRYPDWKTPNYDYQTLQAPTFDTDTDGDGLNEGTSRFGNDKVEYTVRYDMDLLDEGLAMGIGADYKLSDRFALRMTYEVFNPGPDPITDFSAYLLFHGHPGNTEINNANGVHDETNYAFGSWQSYRYDSTVYAENVSGLTDNFESGSQISDYISIQTMMPAIEYGAGPYNGHGAGQPASGEHCQIESGTLGMEMMIMGAEATLSRKWSLGDIAPGETKEFEFVMTQRSESRGVDRGAVCARLRYDFEAVNPELLIEHGACDSPAAAQPSDIISGSLSKLALVEGCDPTFDCTQLIDLTCERANYAFDRVTMDGEGHRLDARFYLARPASRFTSWGDGQLSNGRDLFRFFFTPSTASGLDIVDVCEPGLGAPNDGPGSATIGKGQRQFSFDVDAWTEENYQHWLDRTVP